jgi:hypothetical protein
MKNLGLKTLSENTIRKIHIKTMKNHWKLRIFIKKETQLKNNFMKNNSRNMKYTKSNSLYKNYRRVNNPCKERECSNDLKATIITSSNPK